MNALSKNYEPIVVYVNPEIVKYLESPESDKAIVKRLQYDIDYYLKFRTLPILSPLAGKNRGFLRSPLSLGSNGKTHYLWLLAGTNARGRKAGLQEHEVVFEEVRHHDLNDRVINLGKYKSYKKYKSSTRDENDSQVWLTPKQFEAVFSDAEITLIEGLPGTGKTTVLHKKSDNLKGLKQLYLTYSNKLTYEAVKSFGSLNVRNNNRRALTFNDFFNELAQSNNQLFYSENKETNFEFSKNQFKLFLENDAKVNYLAWKDNIKALYSELYSHAFGKLNLEFNFLDDQYKEYVLENFSERKNELEKNEFIQAQNVIKRIFETGKESEIFPALYLCYKLLPTFQKNEVTLPEILTNLDVLLIDEIQDLSEIESFCVFLFANLTNGKKNKKVKFVAAGDEAQTIRPTNFTWSSFKNIINESDKVNITAINNNNILEHINLDESLRSPSQISDFLYSLRYFYRNINKNERPSIKEFTSNTKDQYGRVVYYCAKDASEYKGIIKKVNNLPTGVSIYTGIKNPDLPSNVKLSSSEEVKGLDYSTVLVADIGKTLVELKEYIRKSKSSKKYNTIIRSTIDNLMVAVSRPTHTLILLDRVQDKEWSEKYSYNANDFISVVKDLYVSAGLSIEKNTLNIYKNNSDLIHSLDLFVDREEYITSKLNQIKNGILDNPSAVTESLTLLFEEAKQQNQDGDLNDELFNDIVDIAIRHSVSLIYNKSVKDSEFESFEHYFKDVLEIKYPQGRYITGDTGKRVAKEKQLFDTFFEITNYYKPNTTSFIGRLNLINKLIKNYSEVSKVLNSVVIFIDKLILDWHRNLTNETITNIEQLEQVIKLSGKISEVLLKSDKERLNDFRKQTLKTLNTWSETSESNGDFEIALYLNKYLKRHSGVVRVYKRQLQHNNASDYINSLSTEDRKKISKEEVIIFPTILEDLNKTFKLDKLHQEEVKAIIDHLNRNLKAG